MTRAGAAAISRYRSSRCSPGTPFDEESHLCLKAPSPIPLPSALLAILRFTMKPFTQLARRKALSGLATPRLTSQTATSQLWRRNFSATASAAQLAALDASKLTVTKTQAPKELTPPQDLVFGKTFTGRGTASAVIGRNKLTSASRPHDLRRVDGQRWMAQPSNYSVSEPQPRPVNLRAPLCFRMLRGNEGLQG